MFKKKLLHYLKYILPAAAIVTFVALGFLSRSAALIFNYAMSEQDMLRGTITAETIKADMKGKVSFTNFKWQDVNGNTIIFIPDGSFKVKIFDIITRNFKASTIEELTINNADISVRLDENMRPDFVRHSAELAKLSDDEPNWETKVSLAGKTEAELKEIGERKRKRRREKVETQWKNFNHEGRRMKLKLNMAHCRIEVFFKERHYLLSSVNIRAGIDTERAINVKAYTGIFGGTMIGRGMNVTGKIDCRKKEVPECDLSIVLHEVDPSSLGFGLNIHDTMTLHTHFTGQISHPVGNGILRMNELHIPGLEFSNLTGKIYYEDSVLYFSDVNANVYGGTLAATGDYNMDTRYYHIFGKGKNLKARRALHDGHLSCDVALDLTIESKGNARQTISYGSFESGSGRFRWVPFDRIAGEFSNAYHDLRFYNVAIDIGDYHVMTDAFSITEGKLTMNPIELKDDQNRTIMTYNPQK